MPRANLTQRSVPTLPCPPEKEQVDFYDESSAGRRLPGFYLRVYRTGRRVFGVAYRSPTTGRTRRQSLGRYPATSLSIAREAAQDVLAAIDRGIDPADGPDEVLSFQDVADRALELLDQRTRTRTRAERRRILDRVLRVYRPEWATLPADQIRRADIAALSIEIAETAGVMANRTVSCLRAIFNAAIDLELLEANPAQRPRRWMVEETPTPRYLSPAEIGIVWNALDNERPEARALGRLLLLTGARVGAALHARWGDFGPGEWRIPAAEGRKFRRQGLIVPISGATAGVLADLTPGGPDGLLFPPRNGSKHPVRRNARALNDRLRRTTGLPSFTVHNFRHSLKTLLTASPTDDPPGLGVEPEVVRLMMGWTPAGVDFVHYQGDPLRYRMSERREAFEAWGEFVERAAACAPPCGAEVRVG